MTASPGIVARIHAEDGRVLILDLRERGGKYEAPRPHGPKNGIVFLLTCPRVQIRPGYVTVFCKFNGSELTSCIPATNGSRGNGNGNHMFVPEKVVGVTAIKGHTKIVVHLHQIQVQGRRAWIRKYERGRGVVGSLPQHIKHFEAAAKEALHLLG